MVFFKYKSICVGIPKTATSSLFDTWKNEIDIEHGHNTLLEDYEKYEKGEPIRSWVAERFKRQKGFNSKCFYKNFLSTYYERRILKPANPDDLFTHPEQLAKYNKSKEALIRIKFLQS